MDKINIEQTTTIQQTAMLLLASYPILSGYVSSFNLNYGEISFLIFSIFLLCKKGIKKCFNAPNWYYVFWGVCAFCLFINERSFKITYLIPGGIAFCLFSIILLIVRANFSIEKLYKYYKIGFLFTVFIYALQLLNIVPTQYCKSFILPISDHIGYSGMDLSTLVELRDGSGRPSSLFLEPSYYAQFIVIFLALELFYKVRTDKLYSNFSIFIAAVLILTKSGVGMIGLLTVSIYKVISYSKYSKVNRMYFFCIVPIAIAISIVYINSEIGAEMTGRMEEFSTENSSGYVRVIQGYLFFDNLPLLHKIIGVSNEGLIQYNRNIIVFSQNGDMSLFTNGFFSLLLRNGYLGLLCLFVVCSNMFKNTNALGKCCLFLMLAFSLVEQIYLAFPMLLCMAIANNKTEQAEN